VIVGLVGVNDGLQALRVMYPYGDTEGSCAADSFIVDRGLVLRPISDILWNAGGRCPYYTETGEFSICFLLVYERSRPSSPNPSVVGQSMIFTATVSRATATVTVTFLDGSSPLITNLPMSVGKAAFSVPSREARTPLWLPIAATALPGSALGAFEKRAFLTGSLLFAPNRTSLA